MTPEPGIHLRKEEGGTFEDEEEGEEEDVGEDGRRDELSSFNGIPSRPTRRKNEKEPS